MQGKLQGIVYIDAIIKLIIIHPNGSEFDIRNQLLYLQSVPLQPAKVSNNFRPNFGQIERPATEMDFFIRMQNWKPRFREETLSSFFLPFEG